MGLWSSQTKSQVVRLVGDQIWNYLQNHANPSTHRSLLAGLTRLVPGELDLLLDQRLLQHPRVRGYIIETAPTLLRTMSKTAALEQAQGLGRIRGRIDWARTNRGRMALGGDAPFFAWNAVQRQYDLPENRLVKYLLRKLAQISQAAASGAEPATSTRELWRNQAASVNVICERLLSSVLLRGVADVNVLDALPRVRAQNHRAPEYRLSAGVLDWLETIRRAESPESRELLASAYLVPLRDDALFELFVLTKLIGALSLEGWQLLELRTIRGGSTPVFRLRRANLVCRVFYQHTPRFLSEASNYVPTFDESGITVTARRPDLIVSMRGPSTNWTGLIEVKFSRSDGYIADGVYKCLGYLRDFSTVMDKHGAAKPKAVLVAWSGVRPHTFNPDQDVNVISANRLAMGLRPFVVHGAHLAA